MIQWRKTKIGGYQQRSGCGAANSSTILWDNGDEPFIPAWWPTGRAKRLQGVTRSQNELHSALLTALEGHCVAALK